MAASTLVAQQPTRTIPSGYLTREANSRHWVPGHLAPSLAQTTYLGATIDAPTGNIDRLWLRPDATTDQAMTSHRYRLTMHLGSRGVPIPGAVLPQSFSANHGTDRTRVLDRVTVDFPAHSSPGAGSSAAQPWRISLPLTPFAYTRGNNLQVEWQFESMDGSSRSDPWFVDARLQTPWPDYGYYTRDNERRACPDRGTSHGGECGGPGQRAAAWWYSGGPDLSPTTLLLSEEMTTWGGQSLPFALDAYGFTGCSLYVAPRVTLVGTTDSSGTGRTRFDLNLPDDPNISRAQLYCQFIVQDASAPGGMRFSDRGRFVVGQVPTERLPAIHLYSYAAAATDVPEQSSYHAPILGL